MLGYVSISSLTTTTPSRDVSGVAGADDIRRKPDDAARRASDAVEEALAARMSEGRDLPPLERASDKTPPSRFCLF